MDVRLSAVLLDNLRHKRFLFAGAGDVLERVGKLARLTAQRAAKPHAADKGTLGSQIRLDLDFARLEARVAPAQAIAGLAYTIEYGRRPGRRPPYRPIRRWAEAHGIVPPGRGGSKLVYELRERIRASGTRGVGFMATAQEVAEAALGSAVPDTQRQMREMWERGA